MTIEAIGVVRSQVRERKAMPPLGAPASVEVFPRFAGGLHKLERHSHIWVLGWLDKAERDVLQVTPRGVADRGPGGLHGVFAVRSPARPNPIGLSAARLLSIRGLRLELDRLDFMDGTPVVDLKPYFVTRDAILAANNAPIGLPSGRPALRMSLLMQAQNFHGESCPDLALAVRLVEHFRATACGLAEPERWSLEAPLGRPCLLDALMGMTRATPGRGNLRPAAAPAIAIADRGRVHEYLPRTPAASFGEALEAADEELFAYAPR